MDLEKPDDRGVPLSTKQRSDLGRVGVGIEDGDQDGEARALL